MSRVEECIRNWGVIVEEELETPSSFVAFGRQDDRPVALKVVREEGDEWLSGSVLAAFAGHGMVRVYKHTEGAMLLERLSPGASLAEMALAGRDDEATEILADVMQRMAHSNASLDGFTTAEQWSRGFERYRTTSDTQVPGALVEHGQRIYLNLCASQRERRLLHGDLQHYNILFDDRRGWLAIDPMGVVGEIEYELGASLRNPYERPELFISPQVVERRLARYEAVLNIDAGRALKWGFAQAVLSAIWSVEDGHAVGENDVSLMLARTMQTML